MKDSHNGYTIADDEAELLVNDAGSGNVVLFLERTLKSPLADRLAESFRVISLATSQLHDQHKITDAVTRATDRLSIKKHCLIADPELTAVAIARAIRSAESIEALILLAPTDSSNGESIELPLEQIKMPTLVLFGTRDDVVSPEAGRVYARRIPRCFYTLVYDAGHDIGADRLQALYAIVRDFLEYREKFVVEQGSSIVNP